MRAVISRKSLLLALVPLAVACSSGPPPGPPVVLPPMPAPGKPVAFDEVRAILDGRCVVCHGCNDAPCQLLLSSGAGVERGASKAVVYDTNRLEAAPPTRLFIDAHGAAAC